MKDSPMSTRPATWSDAVALSVGTFTIVPVRPPTSIDKRSAGRAVVLSVAIGALIGAAMWGVVLVFDLGWEQPFISALAAVTFSTAITRGLHLDGLADTADGLGSRRSNAEGVAVMRQSDIGPFGVAALLLALLTQVSCISVLGSSGITWMLIIIQAAARAAAVLACQRGVPTAKPEGMGGWVAQSLGRTAALLVGGLLVAAAASTGLLPGVSTNDAVRLVVALILGWSAASLLVRTCVRRFGGITGDVIGAAIEIALTVMLVVAAATAF